MTCYCSSSNKHKFEPVTHVIFDLDGTLLNTEKLLFDFFSKLAVEYGKSFTKEMHEKTSGNVKEIAYQIVIDSLSLPLTIEQIDDLCKERVYPHLHEVELMPGSREIVNHLFVNNIPMGIATSSEPKDIDIKLTNYQDLKEKFEFILSSTDPEVKNCKPAPDIYLIAAQKFADKPPFKKCLVFEDSIHGLKAALEANMQVVLIPSFPIPDDILKDATITIEALNQTPLELFDLPAFNPEMNK